MTKENSKCWEDNPAIGSSWEEFQAQIFTPEEIAETDRKVKIIGRLLRAREESLNAMFDYIDEITADERVQKCVKEKVSQNFLSCFDTEKVELMCKRRRFL